MNREKQFEQEAIARANSWQQACGVNGRRTADQLAQYGGVNAVKRQLKRGNTCDAFDALAKAGQWNLMLETLVVDRRFDSLFEDEEVNFCLNALLQAGYTF